MTKVIAQVRWFSRRLTSVSCAMIAKAADFYLLLLLLDFIYEYFFQFEFRRGAKRANPKKMYLVITGVRECRQQA